MTDEEAVLATLEDYADAYCAKDIMRLMMVFDDGDDISLIGTGADEFCERRSEIEAVFLRSFSEATATRFQWSRKHVKMSGEFAFVTITLTIPVNTHNGPVLLPVRWTVALSKRSGRWRWLHRHASTAAGSQKEGTAWPVTASGNLR